MILSFRCKDTKQLFETGQNRRWKAVTAVALRKMEQIDRSTSIQQLRVPPGNNLEALKGNRLGQWSIRINDQWRICFKWEHEDATSVEIVDYHD